PVGPAATWSDGREVVVWPDDKTIVDGKDTAIYGNAAFWPGDDVRLLATGRLRKWRLAQVAVPLVKYDPVDRRLQKLTAGKLIVACERPVSGRSLTAAGRDQVEWSDRIGEDAVRRLAVNYAEQNGEYEALTSAGVLKAGPMFNPAVTPRFVIITTSAIQTASTKLANFVTHKQSQGFDVSVVTESEFGGGTGDTAAENIRNWLISHYVTDNIEYVLLIGDPRPTTGTVPMKILYPRNTSETVPSDVYYADLTGNWNLDGDAYYGEYSGDMVSGGIDRFWEVIVGRIPYYGTIADLDNILQKTMDYQNQPIGSVAWRRNALLPMKDPDATTLIYRLGEQIKNDTLVPAGWSYHRVYDLAYSLTPPPETMPCNMTNVTNVWKGGSFGLVVWSTHGTATEAVSVMNTSYAAQLSDNFPAMAFQCSCNNAYPETTGNLCYTLLKKGVVSAVAATRETWYEKGQMNFRATPTNNGMTYRYASRIVGDNATAARAFYDTTMGLDPGGALYWQNYVAFNVHGDPSTSLLPRCQRRYVNVAAPAGGDGTSWATAYQDLQKALADDWAMEVWVAAGTYKPDRGTGNRAASFHLSHKTAVYGGFAGGETSLSQRDPAVNVTILSGDLAGDDGPSFANNAENSYRVVTTGGCDASSVLDGFVIRGGNASGNGDLDLNKGGGMYNAAGSSPVVSSCLFTSNCADYWGGAMYNAAWGASPTVVSCTFDGNLLNGSNGGGAVTNGTGSRAKFVDCLFTGNSAHSGGAIQTSSDCMTVLNCVFTANTARSGHGGAVGGYSSNATYVGCRFHGNTAKTYGGAVGAEGGTWTVTNCIFSGNIAQGAGGGAINNASTGNLKLVNCTLADNAVTYANGNGGGLRTSSGTSTISNCIFWNNRDKTGVTQAGQIYGTTTVINYSCVQGWTGSLGGTGNTGSDPLLADTDGADNVAGTDDDDVRLLPASPAIDAADNTAVPPDTLDLDGDGDIVEPVPFDVDGDARFVADPLVADTGNGTPPIVDMGAYEGARQAFVLSTQSLSIPEGGTAGFTVALAMDPGGIVNVTVAPDPGDAHVTVQSGGSLVFTSASFAVPQPVVLLAEEDADNLSKTALIRVSATGMVSAGVSATGVDNDPVADVLYVDPDAPGANNGSSWLDAYTDLRTAMVMAAAHANVYEIRVAEGVYRPADPAGDRLASFQLRNGLALRGGYAGYGHPSPDDRDFAEYEAVLSGDLSANDGPNFTYNGENSYHVVVAGSADASAILDGFTITAGNANGDGSVGGGMRIQAASPTIINCTFRANTASSAAGIYNYQNGHPTVTNCLFIDNWATNNGAGLHTSQANVTAINCRFIGNRCGGSGNGAGMTLSSAGGSSVVNCLFSGNTGGMGAGAYCSYATATLVNCTFSGNAASSSGGGMYVTGSALQVGNCTFWGNTKGGVADQAAQIYGTPTVNYSCVQGWTGSLGGTGNHGNDPLFADADGPDDV
ncbi:MAG: hypothetical protein GX616_05095, partial [Planctomycetes bacterium]|nr:hypothetical protein [Planctomycetota bacterium]